MIALCTDFGVGSLYVGQLHLILAQRATRVPCVDLIADLPPFRVQGAAYLLAALLGRLPLGSVMLGVVDPGVGTAQREGVVYRVDGRWLVGPGNGLFDVAARRGQHVECFRIDTAAQDVSASFHGRDVFAPVAAALACGETPPLRPCTWGAVSAHWPDDLAEIVYVDPYGNAISGCRAETLRECTRLEVNGQVLPRARTFGDVAPGTAFYYENSLGLLEAAVNQGRADRALGVGPGTPLVFHPV